MQPRRYGFVMEGIDATIGDLMRQRDDVLTYFRGMSADTLCRACTESEDPGGGAWTPKDHLAHLVARERDFAQLLRRAASGETDLLASRGQTSEEQDAYVNRENQREVDARREADLESLLQDFIAAREHTCRLLRRIAGSGPSAVVLTAGNAVPIKTLAGGSGSHARLHLELLERVLGEGPAGHDGRL
jgi:hypothetical protein